MASAIFPTIPALSTSPLSSSSLQRSAVRRSWLGRSNFGNAETKQQKAFLLITSSKWKRRRTLICAVNQDAEESFKKTVEVDRLIDMLRDATANELQKLVVENILAFNASFWIRLAARTDTCKSDDDKAWFWAWSIFLIVFKEYTVSSHNGFYFLYLKMLTLVWYFAERLRGTGFISYEHSRPPCSQDQYNTSAIHLLDIFEEVIQLSGVLNVSFQHIKRLANEEADKLAKEGVWKTALTIDS